MYQGPSLWLVLSSALYIHYLHLGGNLFSTTDKETDLEAYGLWPKPWSSECLWEGQTGPNLVLSSSPAFGSREVRKGNNSKVIPTLSNWGTGGMVIPPPKQGGFQNFRESRAFPSYLIQPTFTIFKMSRSGDLAISFNMMPPEYQIYFLI